MFVGRDREMNVRFLLQIRNVMVVRILKLTMVPIILQQELGVSDYMATGMKVFVRTADKISSRSLTLSHCFEK